MADDDVDFVVAAWREDGRWIAVAMPHHAADSLETLVHGLRQQPGEGGVLGLVSLGDDTTVIVRTQPQGVRAFVSDPTAAEDFAFVAEVADLINAELGLPEDIDLDDPAANGDPSLLADFGMPADELSMLGDDPDLYPDDVLAAVADRLGFPDDFRRARDEAS